MTTLRAVDRGNWVACAQLGLREDQVGLVASNLKTIAESKFESHYHLRAIQNDAVIVGMLAYCQENDPDDPELYWIFRLMIDQSFQGKGIGFAAMKLAIEEIRELGATRIRTMHQPGNAIAGCLYRKLGFQPTGEVLNDGDIVLERWLRSGAEAPAEAG